jgi:hypothetical protein
MQGILKRIERAEKAAKAQSIFSPNCICFPENEPPFFVVTIEEEIASQVKCPLHGERFKPRFHIYVARWLREKQPSLLWTLHSEQYRKAWFATFPPDLWPGQQECTAEGVFLVLKDGSRIPWEIG